MSSASQLPSGAQQLLTVSIRKRFRTISLPPSSASLPGGYLFHPKLYREGNV